MSATNGVLEDSNRSLHIAGLPSTGQAGPLQLFTRWLVPNHLKRCRQLGHVKRTAATDAGKTVPLYGGILCKPQVLNFIEREYEDNKRAWRA